MFPISYTALLFIKVALAFYLLYIFLPSKVIAFDEHGNEPIDKVFISFTHANFVILVLVHLLVFMQIYETLSLGISIIVLLVIYYSLRDKYLAKHQMTDKDASPFTFFLDLADGRLGITGGMQKYFGNYLKTIPGKLKLFFIHFFLHPFDGIFLFALLVVAGFIRLRHAFSYLYYGASDCYVHLAWTKYMGINNIYQDGVYPYGYEAIISALNKMFFLDPVVIVRFFGGIGSIMLVLSIYYILKKSLPKQYILIFVGVAAYVLGTDLPNSSNNVWRQMSALPQEYATIFLLVGIHFLNVYYNTKKKHYLILAAEVLAITVFIHFYAALFLIISYALLSIFYIGELFKPKVIIPLSIAMGAGGIIGILPIGIGLASGKKFHQLSLGFVAESATVSTQLDWKEEIFRFTEVNGSMKMLMLCSAIILFYAFIRLFFKKSPEYKEKIKLFLMFVLLSLFTYTQVRAPEVGFPTIMEFSRASAFFGVIVVVLFAMAAYIIEYLPLYKILRYVMKLAAAALIIVTVFHVQDYKQLLPVGAKLEYDEAAYAYYRIKKEFPILNWTIISPVEQYQQSLGYGWHYNLWQFVDEVLINPKDKVDFPTDYVFLVVEKRPLNQTKPYEQTELITQQDAQQPFPEVGYAYEKYYTNYNNRRIIEAKAYYWVEDFISRRGEFTVYMENEVLKIYMIKQDGTEPINLAN